MAIKISDLGKNTLNYKQLSENLIFHLKIRLDGYIPLCWLLAVGVANSSWI